MDLENSLCVLDLISLPDTKLPNIFSQSVVFHFLNKVLNFDEVLSVTVLNFGEHQHIYFFSFMVHVFDIRSKKSVSKATDVFS